MDITFQNIMPKPLASIQHQKDSIWGNDFVLVQGKKILLNASSGKGKSTFTNLILGLRKDYEGKLLYDNRDTLEFTTDEWTTIRQKDISVVFQDLQLFPTLTVKENLQLKSNLTRAFNDEELLAMLRTLEIEDKWNQQCGLLSMGQQQRVAIIRALSQPFNWLILDEPFSHLDDANAQRSLKLINERCDQLQAGFVLTSLGDSHQFNYDQELKL